MSPNREPKWISKEPVKSANAEFQEALKSSPFVGAVAVEALAQFIKATNTIRAKGRPAVSAEEATAQVIARITSARDVAEAAPDEVYTQIFNAQLQGWESAARTIQGQPVQQEVPTLTAKKPMSGGKSNRT
jgi:hypothetical protein